MTRQIDFSNLRGPEPNAWQNFELLCANLIELRYSEQNVSRVRADPGDNGMDIVVGPIEQPNFVFQCKYFLSRIGESQKQQIRRSYRRLPAASYPWNMTWTLVTPIDPSAGERSWFDSHFVNGRRQSASRWWGRSHLINLLTQFPHVGEAYFGWEETRMIKEIHQAVVNNVETLDDDQGLQIAYLFFDRPAFRLGFTNEASIPDFRRAIEDTILALNLGILRTRDGHIAAKGKPKSSFVDKSIRDAMEVAVNSLEELASSLAKAIEGGVFRQWGNAETVWVFDRHDFRGIHTSMEMNRLRNAAIDAMNSAFQKHGIEPLPKIDESYIGDMSDQFICERDSLD